ncbi:hypothetical protein FEE95_07865 [Maribacter algarum]|uniref:Beta-lactamase-inhibitor-like PepSY-like domain-containing protein n=1 Tax=Maribacter algarum (ex Zhang et al. 2020) TaxID=2578118 RepID=A0A5S3PWR2_9FLAO|nr:hypothetical protein [Maribacter algarum]TMM59338.1 hypothetical protein FEE95_07865 [Maribacter algarum]
MKKLMLVALMAFGTMTAFAQEAEAAVEEVATEAVAAQDDFSEVAVDELPAAVTAAVTKNYPTAKIDKAYVNEASQYKLEVSLEDGTAGTLYADAEGNWIEL